MSFQRKILGKRKWSYLQLEALEDRRVPTLLGNQLFPADNPWNERITNAPVATNSSTLVNSIGISKPFHPDFGNALWNGSLIGIPFNAVPGSQPKVHVVIDAYPSESDLVPIPIPANAVIEGDPLPSSQNNGDRHLLVYDQDNNILYETYNTHRPSEEPDGQWHADSEAVWNLNQDSFRTPGFTSADAAGLPILPGLVRPDEVYDQGKITHALRFTVPQTDNAYVFPASHVAGSNNPALPRMGERFRLKQSFDISGFSPANQVILQALKDYGMIVADNGSSWYISGEPSSRWNDNDLNNLKTLNGSDFEAVDLTPEVSGLGRTSGPGNGGYQVTIAGLNFSGGAGRTQVFFGTTQATIVSINADNSITVIAPPHAPGTVDVTVKSPYGTSALVGGDRFTYGNVVPMAYEAFELGADGQVYVQKFDASDSPLGVVTLTTRGQVLSLQVGHVPAGQSELFVLGLDNRVYSQKIDANGNSASGYTLTSWGQVKSFAVGSDAAADPEVFAMGLDTQVYALRFDGNGNVVGDFALTSPGQVKSLSIGKDASGHPELFVIGLDSQVYSQKFDAGGNSLGGYSLTSAGAVNSVSVGSDASGHPEVFVIGLDNQVYAQKFDAAGNPASGYALTTAGVVLSMTVGSDASGHPEVFVVGLDNQVYAQKFDATGTSIGGYARIGAGQIKSLAVGHDAAKHPEVFVIGLDNQIYDETFDASGNSIGGYTLASPGQFVTVSADR
jgi:hypothetical protein